MFNQTKSKEGNKNFGEVAILVMIKEFKHLDEISVPGKPLVIPMGMYLLTKYLKNQALDAMNLIKLKWGGRVNGRSCANGSKNNIHLKYRKIISSPNLSLEYLFITMAIDSYKQCDVVNFDVPGN